MKKLLVLFVALVLIVSLAPSAQAQCTKIKDGTLFDINGNALTLGYDKYGYNYQAHMFNGLYENYSRPITPVTESTINLMMKWSDDWLSNQDCTGDGKLDRGGSTGISRGWLTNHEEGDYLADGEMHHYTYFVKIVYVGPAEFPDSWADKRIWGVYAIIEEVFNDPYGKSHGVDRSRLVNPAGLGYWTN
jgi:hypothetical protein